MRAVTGGKGGTIVIREKGDPSPNKGKTRSSSATFAAKHTRMKAPKMEKDSFLSSIAYLAEYSPDELIEMVQKKQLPAGLAIIVKGWFDKRDGYDNFRKTLEMIFGKPTERHEHTGGLTLGALLVESGMIDPPADADTTHTPPTTNTTTDGNGNGNSDED